MIAKAIATGSWNSLKRKDTEGQRSHKKDRSIGSGSEFGTFTFLYSPIVLHSTKVWLLLRDVWDNMFCYVLV